MTTLTAVLLPTGISLPVADPTGLCDGDFPVFVSLSWAGGTETVRIDSCSDEVPQITRAQADTVAQAFPVGTCVTVVDAPAECELPGRNALPSLPDGTLDKPYDACVTITGLTKNYKIQSYNAPKGVAIALMGDELCFSSDKLLEAHTGFPVRVLLADTLDDTCPDILLTGTLEIIDDCICAPITFGEGDELPAGQVGEPYEASIPFSGSFEGIELVEDTMPEGLEAQIVGNFVRIHGTPEGRFEQLTFAIKNACSCDPVAFRGDVVITAACNDGCTYVWSMTPTVSVPGGTVTTTFIPPKTCPDGTTLSLDVFKADGVTPYILPGFVKQLSLTLPKGSSPLVLQDSDANTELVFKPSAEQQRCLECCSPSITSQRRVVLSSPTCDILFSATNQNITSVGVRRSYSITSPAGCTQAELVTVGTLNGVAFNVTQTVALPFSFTDTDPSVAGTVANFTLTVRGLGTCAARTVCGSPIILTTNIAGSGPPVGAKGGALSLVAGPCGAGTTAACVSLGTCIDLGAVTSTPVVISNLAAGTAFSLEVSVDSGATWPITTPYVSSGPSPFSPISVGTNGAACPGVSASGGVITALDNPTTRFRVTVAGVVLPIC